MIPEGGAGKHIGAGYTSHLGKDRPYRRQAILESPRSAIRFRVGSLG
jgi:hypothetical protein